MKDNIKAKFVNDLRKVALENRDCGSLRQAISRTVSKYVPSFPCSSCGNGTSYYGCDDCKHSQNIEENWIPNK